MTDTTAIRLALREFVVYPLGERRATGYIDPWPSWLSSLADGLDGQFDVVVFQAYRDGSAVTDWHVDDVAAQAVLSLGATRTFGIDDTSIQVHDGDLVLMPSPVRHAVLADPDVTGERLSIVFRCS